MKNALRIVWSIVAFLSLLAVLMSIVAMSSDADLSNHWIILGYSLSALLLSLTFTALLTERDRYL